MTVIVQASIGCRFHLVAAFWRPVAALAIWENICGLTWNSIHLRAFMTASFFLSQEFLFFHDGALFSPVDPLSSV